LLEDRFQQKLRDQEGELARNLGSVETLIKNQLDSIAAQVRQEQDLRAEADRILAVSCASEFRRSKALEPDIRSVGERRA
jgi:hypothetical protein